MSDDIDQTALSSRPITSNNSAEDTLSQYGVAKDPFGDVDDLSFFHGAERRALLDQALHLCQFGNNLVVVVGEAGVGKTAFINQAHKELIESAECCFISAALTSSVGAVFARIAKQLDFEVDDDASPGELISLLRRAFSEDDMARVVILIDDAHHLDDTTLSALISLLQGQNHLHLLVSGHDSLPARFDQYEMVDVLVYDLALKPFTEAETKDYLRFKMVSAGYRGDDLFDDATVSRLWQETDGYPAGLNLAAQTIFFEQDMAAVPDSEKEKSGLGLPIPHMAGLVVLLAALILALVYMGSSKDEDSATPLASSDGTLERDPVNALSTPIELPINQTNGAPAEANVPSEAVKLVAPTAEEPDVVTTSPGASESAASVEPVASVAPPAPAQPVVAPIPSAPANEASSNEIGSNEVGTQAPVEVDKPAAVEAAPPAPLEQKPEPKPRVTASKSEIPASEQAVLKWSDSSFTLQVIGAKNKTSLVKYIQQQPNRESLKLITLMRDNSPWHIVVAGNFSNMEAARKGIQKLPQSQVNSSPWPRKVGDIKKQIKDFRDI